MTVGLITRGYINKPPTTVSETVRTIDTSAEVIVKTIETSVEIVT